MRESDPVWRAGGCHCGAVRFQAALSAAVLAQDCNCSLCRMAGFVHIITPDSRFRITAGEDRLGLYTFGSGGG